MSRSIQRILLVLMILTPTVALSQAPVGLDRIRPGERRSLPSSPSDTEYLVGPEDVVYIQVLDNPELSGLVTVDLSGRIQAPLIGAVRAAGRSPAQLTEDLTERYQLIDRSISEVLVSVAQYNSRSVTLIGAVASPGTYGFRVMPGLWEAILTAGGTLPAAELGRVQIVRQQEEGGVPQTIRVDLSRGIERTPPEMLPTLRPKDRIIVPVAEEIPIGEDRIQVLGAVGSPGFYSLDAAPTLIDALAACGGASPEAQLTNVRLTRRTGDKIVSYKLDLRSYLYEARPMANLRLREGDTISVPQSPKTWDWVLRVTGLLLSIASLRWIFRG